jgi:hypothetical protein
MVWQHNNDVHPVVISAASAIGLAFNLSPHFSPVMIIAHSHILLSVQVYECKEGHFKVPCLGQRITPKNIDFVAINPRKSAQIACAA